MDTIPLFPCNSLAKTLDFYRALGFEVTHEQEQPYIYGAIRQGSIEIHFSSLSVWKAKHGVCLVFVSDIKAYHETYADALRIQYGKIPTTGFPRITRLKKGYTRFHIFDPAGNTLVYIDKTEQDEGYDWSEESSPVLQALQNAEFLRDTYCHDEAAAKVLDKAIKKYPLASPIDRARTIAARAELAIAMGEDTLAQSFREQLKQIPLSDEEREYFRDELQAADELERWLTQKP